MSCFIKCYIAAISFVIKWFCLSDDECLMVVHLLEFSAILACLLMFTLLCIGVLDFYALAAKKYVAL